MKTGKFVAKFKTEADLTDFAQKLPVINEVKLQDNFYLVCKTEPEKVDEMVESLRKEDCVEMAEAEGS